MKEKRYDVQVLNLLLDKYERSALYHGTAKRSQSVSVTVTEKLFPEYFDLSSMAFERMNEQMENLSSMKLVSLIWQGKETEGILRKISLNLEPKALARAYRFVSRKTGLQKEEAVLAAIREYESDFPEFLSWTKERFQKHESVKQYIDIDHPEQIKKILYLAKKIRENQEDIFLRRFSIRAFHDSKIAEHEIGSAVSILTHFQNRDEEKRLRDLTADEVLEEYNIYRNPSWVMLKGRGAPLHLPMGIGISNEDIGRIPWDVDSVPDRILTIENLTSFHQWDIGTHNRDLVIYLGGYANRARREMLVMLHTLYPDAGYLHFGDLDAGGFRIWKNLCVSTGLSIRPYLMDEETYLKHLNYGKPLTENDRRMLKRMQNDPFFKDQKHLFELMLERGKKIEQECIVL